MANNTQISVRRVTVQKLRKAGISSREIIVITGHKTEESLKNYDDINRDDHRRLSNILSGRNGAIGMGVLSQSTFYNMLSVKYDNSYALIPLAIARAITGHTRTSQSTDYSLIVFRSV